MTLIVFSNKNKIILLLSLGFICLIVSSSLYAKSLEIKPFYDFGIIDQEDKPSHVFKIYNSGSKKIHILSIREDCSACAKVVSCPNELEPGESYMITVDVFPKQKRGETLFKIVLKTNAPDQEFIFLELRAFICGFKIPEKVHFGNLHQNLLEKRKVELCAFGKDSYRLLSIIINNQCFTANVDPGSFLVQSSHSDLVKMLSFDIVCDSMLLKSGDTSAIAQIIIENITQKKRHTFETQISAFKEYPIKIRPSRIFFGKVPINEKVVRECVLDSPLPLDDIKISTDSAMITVQTKYDVPTVDKSGSASTELLYIKVIFDTSKSEHVGLIKGELIFNRNSSEKNETVGIIPWLAFIDGKSSSP